MADPGLSTVSNLGGSPSSKTSQSCPSYTVEQWLERRELITHLYIEEDLTLKQVRIILEEDHGFPATERQFKRKIKEWKLDKNVKDEEMRIILQHKKTRSELYGKDSVFYVRGRLVDHKKLQRFVQRKGEPEGPEPSQLSSNCQLLCLPEDIICQTPVNESPPSFMKIDEQELKTTGTSSEGGHKNPEDHRMAIFGSSVETTGQNGVAEVNHAALKSFWEPWWPDHNPDKDILDFGFLNLPVQIPTPDITNMPGIFKPQLESSNVQGLIESSREHTANERRKIESMDRSTTKSQRSEPPFKRRKHRPAPEGNEGSVQGTTMVTVGKDVVESVLEELQAIRHHHDSMIPMMRAIGWKLKSLGETASNFRDDHGRHEESLTAIRGIIDDCGHSAPWKAAS